MQKCGTRDMCGPFRIQHSVEYWDVIGYRCCSFVPHSSSWDSTLEYIVFCAMFCFHPRRNYLLHLGRGVGGELILGIENYFKFSRKIKKSVMISLMIVKYSLFQVMRIMILIMYFYKNDWKVNFYARTMYFFSSCNLKVNISIIWFCHHQFYYQSNFHVKVIVLIKC